VRLKWEESLDWAGNKLDPYMHWEIVLRAASLILAGIGPSN